MFICVKKVSLKSNVTTFKVFEVVYDEHTKKGSQPSLSPQFLQDLYFFFVFHPILLHNKDLYTFILGKNYDEYKNLII